jgi:hypothetical protein
MASAGQTISNPGLEFNSTESEASARHDFQNILLAPFTLQMRRSTTFWGLQQS